MADIMTAKRVLGKKKKKKFKVKSVEKELKKMEKEESTDNFL